MIHNSVLLMFDIVFDYVTSDLQETFKVKVR